MNPSPEQNEKLERAIHQTLRALPPRRAPRTLQARVLAELERRAALPWWRQSFAHWPLAAQAVFLLATAGLVKLTFLAAGWATGEVESTAVTSAFSTPYAWLQTALSVGRGLADFASLLFHSIPPLWLYSAAAFAVVMYATLFGLGAAAYRTLYASR
ncbi:MAG: hypothetical protein NTV51_07915 [Verrucomicrobia bacterium]|nr:hypothetical protein [Verrucomicrobiota bacterium]